MSSRIITLQSICFISGQLTFLDDYYEEVPSDSVSSLSALKAADISSGASYYIGALSGVSFVLAVVASYLYFKIRWKFNRENNLAAADADDDMLRQGIQASLANDSPRRYRNVATHRE